MRLSRWKPVCPECGYSLRGSHGTRCPECGTEFPSKRRGYRRWAVRRLPWDRLRRESLIWDYFKSLFWIIAMPGKAARGTAMPDRWRRAVIWAVVHLLLATTAATLLANEQRSFYWIKRRFQTPGWLSSFGPSDPSPARMAVWTFQSFAAWACVLISVVAILSLLSLLTPRRHPAAKRSGAKWSLYLTPLFLLVLAGWYGYQFAFPKSTQPVPAMPAFTWTLPPPEIPPWVLILPFGIWGAIGLAFHPYNGRRRWIAVVVYAAAFFGAWWLTTRVLFAPGPLVDLR